MVQTIIVDGPLGGGQLVRGHSQAAGAKGELQGGFGRSRGGFTGKIHARCDGQGRPLGFVLTGGEVSDCRAVPQLLDMPLKSPKALLADKGYDSDTVREPLLLHNILPVIPPKANRREPAFCDYRRYRDRNHVERLFNRLKQFRRIATRYDKTAVSFLGFLCLAAGRVWLPHYINRP